MIVFPSTSSLQAAGYAQEEHYYLPVKQTKHSRTKPGKHHSETDSSDEEDYSDEEVQYTRVLAPSQRQNIPNMAPRTSKNSTGKKDKKRTSPDSDSSGSSKKTKATTNDQRAKANLERMLADQKAEMDKILAQNKEIQATNAKIRAAASKSEMAKVNVNDAYVREMVTAYREEHWRQVKFINAEKARKLCRKVLESAGLITEKTPRDKKLHLLDTYTDSMCVIVNGTRTYKMQRMEKPAEVWMEAHDGELPTPEQMEACLRRSLDQKKPEDLEIFAWYMDKFLPKCVGNAKIFAEPHRRYAIISEAAPKKTPNKPYVTIYDEAFAVLGFENCRERWITHQKIKTLHKRKRIVPCKYKKDGTVGVENDFEVDGNTVRVFGDNSSGKYTESDAGRKKHGAWTNVGLKRWDDLKKMAREGRQSANCKPLETAALAKVRADNGLTAQTHEHELALKNKKPKKKAKEPDLEINVWSDDSDDDDEDDVLVPVPAAAKKKASAKAAGPKTTGEDDDEEEEAEGDEDDGDEDGDNDE